MIRAPRAAFVVGAISAVGALAAGCAARDVVASSSASSSPYCSGTGPPVLVGDGITVGDGDGTPDDVCTGTVAVLTFKRALCTCAGYATSTPVTTDSFDSTAGPYAAGAAGTVGGVGIDGALSASAQLAIGGSLVVAGGSAMLMQDAHVARDLDIAGPLGTNINVTAGGDAKIGGDISLASLMVTGTLTVPAGANLGGTVTAGATVRAPVAITPPCACAASELVDIAAFVASYRTTNDDAAIGLAPARLTGYSGDTAIDLPCGIYYLGAIHGTGMVTLRVTGRVAILVDGDVTMTSPLDVELATSDAELDLMIGGTLTSNARITIGDPAHPSRTRVYVGGNGTINLSGDSQIAANVYAPTSAIAMSAPATVFGSLFVRTLQQAAPLVIHYDEDVQRSDVGCFQ
ncbi:MAG: hypothetical protein JO257_36630 [Deltaproteobacteria bacterium]|nr:hypothetical protein [Deltaproteobacteria bacterium]